MVGRRCVTCAMRAAGAEVHAARKEEVVGHTMWETHVSCGSKAARMCGVYCVGIVCRIDESIGQRVDNASVKQEKLILISVHGEISERECSSCARCGSRKYMM